MTNPRSAYKDDARYKLERVLAARFNGALRRVGWRNSYTNSRVPTPESVMWISPAGSWVPYPILLLWFLYLVNMGEYEPREYCPTCYQPITEAPRESEADRPGKGIRP